jgi:hypothetical protein
MTQDEIIEMAREAGYRFADDTDQRMANHGQWQRNLLEAFAKLVAAKERERLASIAEKNGNDILAMQLRGEA